MTLDLKTLLDKSGNLSSRKLNDTVRAEIIALSPFLPDDASIVERVFCLKNNIKQRPVCKCGNEISAIPRGLTAGYRSFCSRRCAGKNNQLPVEILQERARVKTERQATSVERAKITRTATNLAKYGAKLPWMIKNQTEQYTSKKNLAFAEAWKSELFLAGFRPNFEAVEYSGSRKLMNIMCSGCKTPLKIHRLQWSQDHSKVCSTCYTKTASKPQHEINEFIRSLGVNTKINDRVLGKGKFELDILCVEKNIAIEFDGLYWHSEKRFKDARQKTAKKAALIRETLPNLRVIRIFEDEFVEKRDIVFARLKAIFGKGERVYARRCTVLSVSAADQRSFFEANHLHGYVPAGFALGLQNNGEVIAVMSFGRCRFSKTNDIELLRFSTKLGHTVVGGASRLLKTALLRIPKEQDIVTFADLNWNHTPFYEKIGFTQEYSIAEAYFYTKNGKRFSRQMFQKHKLEKLFENYDPNLSANQNCMNNGYFRVWHSGNAKYRIKRT